MSKSRRACTKPIAEVTICALASLAVGALVGLIAVRETGTMVNVLGVEWHARDDTVAALGAFAVFETIIAESQSIRMSATVAIACLWGAIGVAKCTGSASA